MCLALLLYPSYKEGQTIEKLRKSKQQKKTVWCLWGFVRIYYKLIQCETAQTYERYGPVIQIAPTMAEGICCPESKDSFCCF